MFKSTNRASSNVNIVDSCTSGARLRYFESLLVAVTLEAIGFKWFVDTLLNHSGIPQWNSNGVWGGTLVKRRYANQELSFSCL